MQLQEKKETQICYKHVIYFHYLYPKKKRKIVIWTLTIYFVFCRSIGMEDIECMDKFVKFNHTIFLFIKKIKNLDKKGKSLNT